MILTLLMFIAAISIAGISAYFSIFGLVALFSASPIAIIIAGSVTEFGKLTLVSYFYQFKDYISLPFKWLLSFIIVTVMAVTSIGVFGFLSSSYLEHRTDQGAVENQMQRIESKIDRKQTKLERNESAINDLDQAYEQYLDVDYISKALEKREEQKEEREKINNRIRDIEKELSDLRDKKSDLRSKQQSVESQVGPIKYFAIALYGDSEDSIDKAVRLLIILLIIILDPFAVTILICANHALANRNPNLNTKIRHKLSDYFSEKSNKNQKDNITEWDEVNYNPDDYDLSQVVENEDFVQAMDKEFSNKSYEEMADEVNNSLSEHDDNIESGDSINSNSDYGESSSERKIGSYSFFEEDFDEDDNKKNKKNNSSSDRWINR